MWLVKNVANVCTYLVGGSSKIAYLWERERERERKIERKRVWEREKESNSIKANVCGKAGVIVEVRVLEKKG